MNLRNVTCVGTQTSKVPTRGALLFILYTVPQYHKSSNLNKNEDNKDFSFGMDVVIFLPGGIAIIPEPAYGEWDFLKRFKNTSGLIHIGPRK